jgi:hypothetical protein
MTTNNQARQRILNRHRKPNQTACAPQLPLVQLLILKAAAAHSPKAVTVNNVIDFVFEETGDMLDVAQVFTAMKHFAKKKLLEDKGKVPITEGHRPSSTYVITPVGKTAITSTEKHMRRVLNFGHQHQKAQTAA